MSDSTWAIVAMLVLLLLLMLYIKKANQYTEEFYGEESFLKKPRAYEVKLRDLIDIELFYGVYYLIMSFILIDISIQLLNNSQFLPMLLIIAMGIVLCSSSIYLFYWKSIFFKQNGNKTFYFNPKEKYFSIIKYDELKINFSDIEEIDFYSTNSKLSISFCIINLKNKELITLTKELKNYYFLSEFFKEIKQNHHSLSFSLFYKWLMWMKNN